MANKRIRPGQTSPASAQYRLTGTRHEITLPKGRPAPPTPRKGQTWQIVDRTNNKSGKG